MNKSHIFLIVALLCSIGFISCEQIPKMTDTIISDVETPEMDMVGMVDMLQME